MKIIIINSAEPEIKEFAENIQSIIQSGNIETEIVEYRDSSLIDFDLCNGVIISGSPQGDDIVEHHQPYFQWIKSLKKPILGICAGHHVTGFMYDAKYLRSVEPESGDVCIDILIDDPVFEGLPPSFKTRQMHNDSITLPENFIHLASSPTCKNQAMRHRDKPLYTFQFHPEYLNPEILLNFVTLCRKQSFREENEPS